MRRASSLVLLILAIVSIGCSKYSENDRLNYLDDASSLLKEHRSVLDMDPESFNPRMEADATKSLSESFQSFKRQYQGTDLDEDFGIVADFEKFENIMGPSRRYMSAAPVQYWLDKASAVGAEPPFPKDEALKKRDQARTEYTSALDGIEKKIASKS